MRGIGWYSCGQGGHRGTRRRFRRAIHNCLAITDYWPACGEIEVVDVHKDQRAASPFLEFYIMDPRASGYTGAGLDGSQEFYIARCPHSPWQRHRRQKAPARRMANRLNAPTPWTRSATSHFLTTSRALTRVLASFGPGPGGALMSLRINVTESEAATETEALKQLLLKLSSMPEITGAHLLKADEAASGAKTNESKDRKDIEAPARWAILVEACSARALKPAMTMLRRRPILKTALAGRYLHEHTRLKTAFAVG